MAMKLYMGVTKDIFERNRNKILTYNPAKRWKIGMHDKDRETTYPSREDNSPDMTQLMKRTAMVNTSLVRFLWRRGQQLNTGPWRRRRLTAIVVISGTASGHFNVLVWRTEIRNCIKLHKQSVRSLPYPWLGSDFQRQRFPFGCVPELSSTSTLHCLTGLDSAHCPVCNISARAA
jgi:hypothetical protein